MLSASLDHYTGHPGDGIADCTSALETALATLTPKGGLLFIPPGDWLITRDLVVAHLRHPIALRGAGAGVSRLGFQECAGLDFRFDQHGIQQPAGLDLCDLTLAARGAAGTALAVSYGAPEVTNDHYRPSVTLDRCRIESSDAGWWANGLDLADCWNASLSNLFLSGGAQGGVWANLTGAAINLRRMAVNTHISNVRAAFWKTGLRCHVEEQLAPLPTHHTEGIFVSNSSFVAVQQGVSLRGVEAGTKRISTLTWHGGLIENRVGGVPAPCSAFDLSRVHTALISGVQCITETITANPAPTVAVMLDACHGVTVQGCDLNAYHYGVLTNGPTRAVAVQGNTFTNTACQVYFRAGTKASRSAGNVVVNDDKFEHDEDGQNHITGP